jgi:hypothetical protein
LRFKTVSDPRHFRRLHRLERRQIPYLTTVAAFISGWGDLIGRELGVIRGEAYTLHWVPTILLSFGTQGHGAPTRVSSTKRLGLGTQVALALAKVSLGAEGFCRAAEGC